MALGLLLGKELRSLLREPMVVLMIIMPVAVYGAMAPFYGSAVRQAAEAVTLRGVSLAVVGCGPTGGSWAKVLAGQLSGSVNVSAVESCDPLAVARQGAYDVVVYVGKGLAALVRGEAVLEVYIRGDFSKLMKTVTLSSSAAGILGEALSPRGEVNFTFRSYVLFGDKVWSAEDVSGIFGVGMFLSYATFMILFPAASLGATLVGAEREERMLEVLFSLPIRRRNIAMAKAAAALTAATLAAASALAGFYVFLRSAQLGVQLGWGIAKYYSASQVLMYATSLAVEAAFAASTAMLVGLFTTTIRGAQAAASLAVIPAFLPPFTIMAGVPLTATLSAVPYTAAVYASLSPLIGTGAALRALAAQAAEAAAVLAVLSKLLDSELAVTGPETLKRFLPGRRRRH
ncbi:MAG: ABC transporter permease subunit [Thermoproteota archaeon]